MSKTLGQVAYDAFGAGTPRNPPWSKLWKQEQKWWQAAAEAVIEHYLTTETEAPLDFIKYRHEVRAVIEAAKAYVQQREERPLDPEHVRQALYFDLAETLEALQEVEGE